MIDARAGERACHPYGRSTQRPRRSASLTFSSDRARHEARLLLGDRKRATEIPDCALTAIASAESGGVDIPAEDVLGVLVSRLDADEAHAADFLKLALKLAPFVDDANAWWDIPRLSAHVRAYPKVESDETLANGLAAVAMVVDQRQREGRSQAV